MEDFIEHTVRIESLIYLPGALMDEDSPSHAFRDFCDYMPERAGADLYKQLPGLAKFANEEIAPEVGEVAEVLWGVGGFLIEAGAPVKTWGASGGCYYSWGHYHTEWLYAATEAEIAPVCTAWADKQEASDKTEAQAA